jgi:hypothetical protein
MKFRTLQQRFDRKLEIALSTVRDEVRDDMMKLNERKRELAISITHAVSYSLETQHVLNTTNFQLYSKQTHLALGSTYLVIQFRMARNQDIATLLQRWVVLIFSIKGHDSRLTASSHHASGDGI